MIKFATDPSNVITDQAGNVKAGVDLEVWTQQDGSRITELYDDHGNPLENGVVTSNTLGRYPFWLDDSRRVVTLVDPSGNAWDVFASQSFRDIDGAIDNAAEAMNLASAFGEITRSMSTYATNDQLTGGVDAGPALQALINDLESGGRAIVPAGSTLWFTGATTIELTGHNNIRIDFAGATVIKTSTAGYYNIFNVNGNGTGYGSGIKGLIIENGYFQGSFVEETKANLCLLQANHAQDVIIRNCEFVACQLGAGHVIDLGGCDKITIEDCVWRGFKHTDQTPRTETVQIDTSRKGSGAGSEGNWDGLLCRSIHMNRCQFLPWTDPNTGVKWPAPIPLGAHSAREGLYYEDISATNILVIDPVVDGSNATAIQTENGYVRGLFHFTAVKGLRIQARVIATDGAGSLRIVMIQSNSYGDLASGDPNTSTEQGNYAEPVTAEDIDLDLRVEGMAGTQSALNPLIAIVGVTNGRARDIHVHLSADSAYKEAVYFNRVEKSSIWFNSLADAESGARLIGCQGITVGGNLRQVNLPVRADNSTQIAIGPFTGDYPVGSRPAFVAVSNGANYLSCSNINVSGYTDLYTPTAIPANHAEAAVIGPALPA